MPITTLPVKRRLPTHKAGHTRQSARCCAVTAKRTRCTMVGTNIHYSLLTNKYYRVCNKHHGIEVVHTPGTASQYVYPKPPRRGYWPDSGVTSLNKAKAGI